MTHEGSARGAVDAFVDHCLAPWLEGRGFRRNKDLFVRFGPVTHFVELERSRFSSDFGTSFRLTLGAGLGLTVPKGKPQRKQLYDSGPTPILRPLSALSGGPVSYALDKDAEARSFATTVLADLERAADPFFENTKTPDALVQWLEAEQRAKGTHESSFLIALQLVSLGRREEAAEHFRNADGHRPTIIAVAKAHGIDIEA